ncbi:recombinase family protein [Peribacillus frigoritolerans]|uniref:recombinase family protein n=1 Tax=Peribacillus frigoritolerans TaxID=450367 RepID=UPI00345CBE21
MGSFAQFERDLIVERTTEGRERAKKQGKHMERPGQDEKTLKRAIKLYHERKINGMSVNDIVKAPGIPRSTLYAKIETSYLNNKKRIFY